jgi:hypothetical protein
MTKRVAVQASELSDMALGRVRCIARYLSLMMAVRAAQGRWRLPRTRKAARGRPCNDLRRAVAALFDQHRRDCRGTDRRGKCLEKVVASAAKFARAQVVAFESHNLAGHPVPSIFEFVRRGGYDLLVLSYVGKSALYNGIIRSTTHRLVELAPSKVMIVK